MPGPISSDTPYTRCNLGQLGASLTFAFYLSMPRAKVILQPEFPYNISARCINQEWFNLPMERVWDIMCEELLYTIKDRNLLIHCFVLMSNHFHLIASTPDSNISSCMHQFMHRSSLRLTREGNRINETYAGRHYKCILQHPNYFLNAYKYIYRNPVVAGICERVEDYRFSTLHSKLGFSSIPFPMAEDTTLQSSPLLTLKWLNTSITPEQSAAVKFGLRHQYFKSRMESRTGQPLISTNELI